MPHRVVEKEPNCVVPRLFCTDRTTAGELYDGLLQYVVLITWSMVPSRDEIALTPINSTSRPYVVLQLKKVRS